MITFDRRQCNQCGTRDPVFKTVTGARWPCQGCGALLSENVLTMVLAILAGVAINAGMMIGVLLLLFDHSLIRVCLASLLVLVLVPTSLAFVVSNPLVVRSPDPHCSQCFQNLRGVDPDKTKACPECGKVIPEAWHGRLQGYKNQDPQQK